MVDRSGNHGDIQRAFDAQYVRFDPYGDRGKRKERRREQYADLSPSSFAACEIDDITYSAFHVQWQLEQSCVAVARVKRRKQDLGNPDSCADGIYRQLELATGRIFYGIERFRAYSHAYRVPVYTKQNDRRFILYGRKEIR